MSASVVIQKLPSGVPGFDEVLGGGIPEFSFNLIAGGPGSGKTTLAHQIMFANASPERKAVYFSIIGEPPIKMLRYQQQYAFFDAAKVGDGTIRFIHLGLEALRRRDGEGAGSHRGGGREVQTGNRRRGLLSSHRAKHARRRAERRAGGSRTSCSASRSRSRATRPRPSSSGNMQTASTTARCSRWRMGSSGSTRPSTATPSCGRCT